MKATIVLMLVSSIVVADDCFLLDIYGNCVDSVDASGITVLPYYGDVTYLGDACEQRIDYKERYEALLEASKLLKRHIQQSKDFKNWSELDSAMKEIGNIESR